jgi:hypothetical protein
LTTGFQAPAAGLMPASSADAAAPRGIEIPEKGFLMFNLQGADQLRSAQAKWERLTAADYAEIKTLADLVAALSERYSLPHAQAQRDVEAWARALNV